MTVPRVALTTTPERASGMVSIAAAVGLEAVVLPCIRVASADVGTLAVARSTAERSDWVVLTSPRAVHALWPDGGAPDAQIAVVGDATAEAVRDAGGRVSLVGKAGSRDLMNRLVDRTAGKAVFYPHASDADVSMLGPLDHSGATLSTAAVYEIQSIPPGEDRVDAVAFGSPSAVTGWFLTRDLEGLVVGVIGETTRAAVVERGFSPEVVAPQPDFDRLLGLISSHLQDRSVV